jgi:hypothetical protein
MIIIFEKLLVLYCYFNMSTINKTYLKPKYRWKIYHLLLNNKHLLIVIACWNMLLTYRQWAKVFGRFQYTLFISYKLQFFKNNYHEINSKKFTTYDGRQVMRIAHMTLWVRWAKKSSPTYLGPKISTLFWCTGWAWNQQIIFRFTSIHGRPCFVL